MLSFFNYCCISLNLWLLRDDTLGNENASYNPWCMLDGSLFPNRIPQFHIIFSPSLFPPTSYLSLRVSYFFLFSIFTLPLFLYIFPTYCVSMDVFVLVFLYFIEIGYWNSSLKLRKLIITIKNNSFSPVKFFRHKISLRNK